jgi:hypothetical protein
MPAPSLAQDIDIVRNHETEHVDLGDVEEDYEFEDWVDSLGEIEPAPFPDGQIDIASAPVLMTTALTLISNVLRDSELVDDLSLKADTLLRTLRAWGTFVSLLEEDEPYVELVRNVGEALADSLQVARSKRHQFVDEFVEMGPVLVGFGGMAATLASRKLERILSRCFEEMDLAGEARGAVMGALLSALIEHASWPRYFVEVQQQHRSVPAVNLTLRQLGLRVYLAQSLGPEQEADLEHFLATLYVTPRSKQLTSQEIEAGRQQLRQQRRWLLTQRRELAVAEAARLEER